MAVASSRDWANDWLMNIRCQAPVEWIHLRVFLRMDPTDAHVSLHYLPSSEPALQFFSMRCHGLVRWCVRLSCVALDKWITVTVRSFLNVLNIIIGSNTSEVESESSVDEEPYDIGKLVSHDDEKFFRSECEVENTCYDKYVEISLMILWEFHRLFDRKYFESARICIGIIHESMIRDFYFIAISKSGIKIRRRRNW